MKIEAPAVVAQKERVYKIRAFAQVLVQLTESHEYNYTFTSTIAAVRRKFEALNSFARSLPRQAIGINSQPRRHGLATPMLERLRFLEQRLHYTSKPRSRRGLFNFIGHIASTLFGVATSSDTGTLKTANSRLATEVEGVVREQGRVIAKVNLLGRAQQAIETKVNELVDAQNRQINQLAELRTETRATQRLAEINAHLLRLVSVVDLLDAQISEYEQYIALMHSVRYGCETDTINEQVIPFEMMSQIVTSG